MSMVVKKLIIISFLALFQTSPASKVILFYGDSLTAGYGLSTDDAFPAVIEKTLNKKGKANEGGECRTER